MEGGRRGWGSAGKRGERGLFRKMRKLIFFMRFMVINKYNKIKLYFIC
jgi:hypothetical protein